MLLQALTSWLACVTVTVNERPHFIVCITTKTIVQVTTEQENTLSDGIDL